MRTHKTLVVRAKAPNSRGTFEGIIEHNPPGGDSDGERIESWTNLPGSFPLGYLHAYGDPGAQVGTAEVLQLDYRRLKVLGRLDLANPMAQAVHERMLLPPDNLLLLAELSVGFTFDPRKTTTDPNGVRVLRDATLEEVSVVHRGAQSTAVSNVKADTRDPVIAALRKQLDALVTPPPQPDVVDAFVAQERARLRAERDERQRQREWEQTMSERTRWMAEFSAEFEAEAEAERRSREAIEFQRREAVRVAEAAERERVDVDRRQAAREDPRVFAA
jgi:hypothetical protein